jgi:hypothetical protein
MSKSTLERNWDRAGRLLKDIGSRVAPFAGSAAVVGSTVAAAAGTGMDVVAQRVRRASSPWPTRAVARKLEQSVDYLRYRSGEDMARDAWRAVNRRSVWVTASSVLAGLITYRLLSRD